MREVTIHLENGHPVDCHINNQPTRPVSSFLLLANVPAEPPGCIMLSYGNSDNIANLIMTLWQRSVYEDPKTAHTLEMVSRGIVEMADAERNHWPSDEVIGRA